MSPATFFSKLEGMSDNFDLKVIPRSFKKNLAGMFDNFGLKAIPTSFKKILQVCLIILV